MAQKEYIPQPLPTDAVRLPANVIPVVETLAHDIHMKWFRERLSDGWTLGPDGPNSSPLLKAWASLTDKQKESSRSRASESLKLVYACGYELRPGAGGTDEDIMARLAGDMARNAHEVWARDKMDEGWSYGEKRDDERKLHPDLRPYDELSPREREDDLFVAQAAVDAIAKAGCRIAVAPKIDISHLEEMERYLGEMGFKDTEKGPVKDMMFDSAVDYAVRKGFTLDEIKVFDDTKQDVLSGGQKAVPSTEAQLDAARAAFLEREFARELDGTFEVTKKECPLQFNELRCENVNRQIQRTVEAFNRKERQAVSENPLSAAADRWRLVGTLSRSNPDFLEDLTASWSERTMQRELGCQPYLEQAYNNFAGARSTVRITEEASGQYYSKSAIGRMLSRNPEQLRVKAIEEFSRTQADFVKRIRGLEMIGTREELGEGMTVHIGISVFHGSDKSYDYSPMLSITAYDGSCAYQENVVFQKDGTMKNLPIRFPESEIGITGRYHTDHPGMVAAYRKFDSLKEEMAAAVLAVHQNPVVSKAVRALPPVSPIHNIAHLVREVTEDEQKKHVVSMEVERKWPPLNKMQEQKESRGPVKVEAELNIGAPSINLINYTDSQKQSINEEVLPYLRGFGIPEKNIKELLETGRTSVNGEINVREKHAYDTDVPQRNVNVKLEFHGWAVNAIDPATGRNLGALDQFAASTKKNVNLSGERKKMEQELSEKKSGPKMK